MLLFKALNLKSLLRNIKYDDQELIFIIRNSIWEPKFRKLYLK